MSSRYLQEVASAVAVYWFHFAAFREENKDTDFHVSYSIGIVVHAIGSLYPESRVEVSKNYCR